MNIKKILAALVLAPAIAFAWEPTKTVTVIVGNTPGAAMKSHSGNWPRLCKRPIPGLALWLKTAQVWIQSWPTTIS